MKTKLLYILMMLFVYSTFAKGKPVMQDVAGKLSCYCGTCPHLVVTECGCSTAGQIKADIQKMIDEGQTEDQIIQSYVAKHGQTVLAAPPKSGFNLTAWVLPFLAFAIGGFLVIAFLKKERKAYSLSSEPAPREMGEKELHYRDLLKQELEERK